MFADNSTFLALGHFVGKISEGQASDLAGLANYLTSEDRRLRNEGKRLLLTLDEYEAIDVKIGDGVFPRDLLAAVRESDPTVSPNHLAIFRQSRNHRTHARRMAFIPDIGLFFHKHSVIGPEEQAVSTAVELLLQRLIAKYFGISAFAHASFSFHAADAGELPGSNDFTEERVCDWCFWQEIQDIVGGHAASKAKRVLP